MIPKTTKSPTMAIQFHSQTRPNANILPTLSKRAVRLLQPRPQPQLLPTPAVVGGSCLISSVLQRQQNWLG